MLKPSLSHRPPAGNTGVELTNSQPHPSPRPNELAVGWLAFTTSLDNLPYCKEFVRELFLVDLEHTGHGFQGYANCLAGSLGVSIWYTDRYTQSERDMLGIKYSPNEGTCHVELPQSALDILDAEKTVLLFAHLVACDAKVTRLDVSLDDYDRVIEPHQIYQQWESFEVCVPRFKTVEQYRKAAPTRSGRPASTGDTVYIGSRSSDKFIRVYDKFQESDGEKDCVRWEAQYRRDVAHHAFMWLFQEIGQSDDFAQILQPLLRRLLCKDLDFRVNPDPNCDRPQNWATRWQVAPWWQRLMGGIEKAQFRIPRIKPTVEGIINWVEHQVLTSLSVVAAVKRFRGEEFFEWFYSRLAQAEKRWGRRHNAIFDENARLTALLT